jgi:hypothetical protein
MGVATKILGWKHTKEAAAVFVALLLYLVGVKFLLLPVILYLNVRYIPLPKIFGSWLSRTVVAFLFVAVLLQAAAAVQFVLFPNSNFMALAGILVLLQIGLWYILPVQKQEKRRWFASADLGAVIVAAFFLLPFAPMIVGINTTYDISKIGGIQAIDATNHYVGITEMMRAQHLDYTYGHYYPKGFHIATGFVQNTVMNDQFSLGFRGNVVLFFAQYVVMGLLLAYMVFYFAASLLQLMARKVQSLKTHVLLALCLGPMLAVFYLIAFIPEGFLNYYYVIATILAGFTCLIGLRETNKEKKDEGERFLKDDNARWLLTAYFLLAFGASVSWPLLIPPLVLTGAWFVLPGKIVTKQFLQSIFTKANIPLIVALLLHLVPIYFQLRYTADSSQGINAVGGLREFRGFFLVAGAVILIGLLWHKGVEESTKKLLLNLYVPLGVFIVLLIAFQYFTTGEVRYYAIKSGMLLEILFFVLGVVALVFAAKELKFAEPKYMIMLPAVPIVVMLLLVHTVANPLKDVRDLFRDKSHQEKPAFFDHDMSEYDKLGTEGKIQHYNSTILHYNADKDQLYAHMQASFWANMMQYDGDKQDFDALLCNSTLYSNLAFGSFTKTEQEALVAKVKECAGMAKDMGLTYYIITDHSSAPKVKSIFDNIATYVE